MSTTDRSTEEITEAANGRELLARLREKSWDLLYFGCPSSRLFRFELLCEIRHDFPGMPVLVISDLPGKQYAVEALHAGASGFLSNDSVATELLVAAKRALSGIRYVSAAVAKQTSKLGKPNAPNHEPLPTRERQLFERLITDVTITLIAEALEVASSC